MPTSESPFGWAIVGPGRIAHRFAEAVGALPGTRLAAVWGRDAGRAGEFAAAWAHAGAPQATSHLPAVLDDPAVHAVYIATPHAQHGEFIAQALRAGKPVLCEKPLVPTLAQAEPLVALSRQAGVFLMEAMWTRYLPVVAVVGEWLRAGAIGPLRTMQSSFCFPVPFDATHRCFAPALAGGALLDIGVYNLSVTRWVLAQSLGTCPELRTLDARALIGPTGVDHRLHAMLGFDGGIVSQFVCGFDGRAANTFRIDGEAGHITLHDGFWQATRATLVRDDAPPLTVDRPFAVNGFEGQVVAAMQAIRAGAIEEPAMPHRETLATLQWMDRIRAQVGLRYPFE